MGSAAINQRLALSLDVARAAAASYVVLHHIALTRGWGHGAGLLLRFGQEAVIVFFLLSGFVIFANEHERAFQPEGYLIRRIRRIYPPMLAAMALSVAIAADNGTLLREFSGAELVGNLLNLQDVSSLKPGVWFDAFMGNDPLWSLSYELAFYLVFPFTLRLHKTNSHASHIIGLVCCLAFLSYLWAPNHLSLVAAYFQIWWLGAMIADAYMRGRRDARSVAVPLGYLVLLAGIAGAAVAVQGYAGLGVYPFLMVRHFAFAALMATLLFGPFGRHLAALASQLGSPARKIAGISYGLYVLHFPIIARWDRTHDDAALLWAMPLIFALAYVVEHPLMKALPRAPKT